jgi:hypothetical protein
MKTSYRFTKCILLMSAFSWASMSFSQILPEGTGAVAFGQRQYSPTSTQYDQGGQLRSLGNRIDMDFDSRQMASGALGEDLKRLYDETKLYDSANTGKASLADQLNFGNLRGDIQAKINANYLGAAYGLRKNLTIFTGLPFIRSTVTANLTMEGQNTANAVKARLGNLAFKDIQDGLDTASGINIWTVKKKISEDYGYIPADKWEYAGIGDFLLGARSSMYDAEGFGGKYNLQLSGQVEFPTGHADNPDILTDAALGKGYVAPMVSAQQTASYGYLEVGLDTGLGIGIPTQTTRRVPVDNEALITLDRKTKVNWIPGPETKVVSSLSFGPSLVKGSYRLGVNQHFRDRYSGKLRGNYSTLEKDSETQEQFHQFGITINTVDAYLSNKFALPMIASLTAHESLGGRNTVRSRYIELSIATFFKGHTPRAELADESPRVEPQMTKTVSQTDAIPAITEDGE